MTFKEVNFPHCRTELIELLQDHREAIALLWEPLGSTSLTRHTIHIQPGTAPIYIPTYRIPHSKKAEVKGQIAGMLDQGVIRHSSSPWNFPLFLVPKKDGPFRPVVDFRKVNQLTVPDRLPLPVMRGFLQSVGSGNQVFSTIDLKSAFWQIEHSEDSIEVTGFSVDSAHFEFNRMPFGLCNAPSTLQRLVNNLFSDNIWVNMFIYLDDLVIFSGDLPSHLSLLREVPGRLLAGGLKVEISNCHFLKKKISFL